MSEKEAIVEKLKSIAGDLNASSVPRHEFLRRTGLSERKVQRLFGSYNNLVVAAGLQPRAFPTADAPSYSNDELLAEVVRVIRLPDAKLTRVFFEQNAKFSSSVCERRFGGWVNTVKTAAELLDPHKEEELLRLVREYTAPPHPPRVQDSPSHNSQPHEIQEQQEHPGHEFIQTSSANVYGEFINFRGLQHAPMNEQGVVFCLACSVKNLVTLWRLLNQVSLTVKRREGFVATPACGNVFGLNSNISPETSGHTVTTQISATLLSVGSTTGLNVP